MFAKIRRLLRSDVRARLFATNTRRTTSGAPSRRPQPSSDLDLLSADVVQNPFPHYAALRQSGAVQFLTKHDFWLVLGYDEVMHALKDPRVFSSVRPAVRFDPVLNEADPPAHTRVRRILTPHFSAQAVQTHESAARSCAEELLTRGAKTPEFDLVENFAAPLTESLMSCLVGFSVDETAELRSQLNAHKRRTDGSVYRVLEDWLRDYVKRVHESPGASFSSKLLQGTGDAVLSPDEVVALLKLFWVAGTTTTSRLIAAAALLLLEHEDVRTEVRRDSQLLPVFIDEAMRLQAPEQMVWRVATRDVELAGAKIAAGADVRLSVAAANRDPAHFPEPDRISLSRNPNHHLSFAAGPHYCIGAAMGRMLARVALETLLAGWPEFSAARPLSTVRYEESFSSRAVEHLFVRAT